jgi:hypothetical protein
MGIDTTSKIIVGLYYEDLIEHISEEDLQEFLDEGDLGELSPYYDAPRDDCAFGVNVIRGGSWLANEIDMNDFITSANRAKTLFKKVTGVDGKVLFGAHVY